MPMNRPEAIALRQATTYPPSEWKRILNRHYSAAKRRHGGQSLTIYGKVTIMLDYLDGWEEIPKGFDLARELNDLAAELRRE